MAVSLLMAANPKMNLSLSLPSVEPLCDPSVRQNSACHMAGTLANLSRLHPHVTDTGGSFLVLPHGSDATDKGLASPSCSAYFLRPGRRTPGGLSVNRRAGRCVLLISVLFRMPSVRSSFIRAR